MPKSKSKHGSHHVYHPYRTPLKNVLDLAGNTAANIAAQVVSKYLSKGTQTETKRRSKRSKEDGSSSRVAGTYQGTFRTNKRGKRKRSASRRFVQGMVVKREARGSVNDPNALYVGCGTPGTTVTTTFVGTIIRELFKQAGYTIESWQQPFVDSIGGGSAYPATSQYTIDYGWFASPDATAEGGSSYTIPSGSTTTIKDIMDGLIAAIRASFSVQTVHDFTYFRLNVRYNNGTANVNLSLATIDPEDLFIRLTVNENVLLQNRTKAGVTTDPDDAEISKDNIFANPLYCVTYSVNGNGFYPKWRNATDASYVGFHPDPTSGVISATAADCLPEEGTQPNPALFEGTRSKRDRIEPGAIKVLRNKCSKTMSANEFMTMFRIFFDTGATIDHTDFGTAKMVGFEKMLTASASEQNVTVAYEMNLTIVMDYSYNKSIDLQPLIIDA